MSKINGPQVPESLLPYADDNFYEVVENFAAQPLEKHVSNMPEVQGFARYITDVPAIQAVVYRPEEYDPKHAVVVPYPFGNGHAPHMHIRTAVMQAVAAPNQQVIVFPNNTASETNYSLTDKQLATVASGDATPIAQSIHATAEELGLESLDLITYSQGAFVGTAVLRLAQERGIIQIKNVLIAEPTNIVKRTPTELRKAFMGSGLFPLIQAVKDSGIPALEQAQAMGNVGDSFRLVKNMLGVQKSSKIKENVAFHDGMAHNNLYIALKQLKNKEGGSSKTRITLARAEKSKVTPNTSTYARLAKTVARNSVEIQGYGHEAADNVSGVYALLAKLALHG